MLGFSKQQAPEDSTCTVTVMAEPKKSMLQRITLKRRVTEDDSINLALEPGHDDDGQRPSTERPHDQDNFLLLMEGGLFGVKREEENASSLRKRNEDTSNDTDMDTILWANGLSH
jgi:hypothetical protein